MKKYDAKNDPKSITSETMKSRIPSVWRSMRELCVGLGRPVVLVLARGGDRCRFHQARASSAPTGTGSAAGS